MAKASQNPKELEPFLYAIRHARSFLEIGSRYGETLRAFGSYIDPKALIVSVELPGAGWGRHDSLPILRKTIDDLNVMGHDAKLIIGDSKDPSIIDAARQLGPFDVVFIDGDHSVEGATADWLNYRDMGDIIAFHDVASKWGVSKVWKAICKQHPYTAEFIDFETPPDRRMGIGMVQLGEPNA